MVSIRVVKTSMVSVEAGFSPAFPSPEPRAPSPGHGREGKFQPSALTDFPIQFLCIVRTFSGHA